MRIYPWPYKLAYVLLAWGINWVTGKLLNLTGTPLVLESVWSCVYILAVFLAAARVFRVAGESAAPRPWWKMTGRPTLSKRLGILFVVIAVVYGLIFAFVPYGSLDIHIGRADLLLYVRFSGTIGIILPFGILGALYLYSRRRLRAQELTASAVIAARSPLRRATRLDPVDEAEEMWLESEGMQRDGGDAEIEMNQNSTVGAPSASIQQYSCCDESDKTGASQRRSRRRDSRLRPVPPSDH